jgi:dihydrodipicolinate synthase/N-acetylneuraminate lyase
VPMNDLPIQGVVPILPTPFGSNDELDLQALTALVDFAVEAGSAAIGTPAFGSEFYKLADSERLLVLESVIANAAGRIPVIAQCNHHSPRHAARLASQAEQMGAAAISVALPHPFPVSAADLLTYARTVCDSVSVPVVVQDWFPGGQSVGIQFVLELRKACGNFRYLKLEESGIGSLIRAIRLELGNDVGVLLGWNGMYVPELQPAGACGVMPGLALADVFVRIWQLGAENEWSRAYALFAQISPYLQFSLQTFEQFHHSEKHLLCARGILKSPGVRPVTIELDPDARRYMDNLIIELRPLLNGVRISERVQDAP